MESVGIFSSGPQLGRKISIRFFVLEKLNLAFNIYKFLKLALRAPHVQGTLGLVPGTKKVGRPYTNSDKMMTV